MNLLLEYGWLFIIIAIVGELLVPFILSFFYKGYSNTKMTISSLGVDASPVRIPFRVWMLIAGVLYLIASPAVFTSYARVSAPFSIVLVALLIVYAIGACILPALFSAEEARDSSSSNSRLHGLSSTIGFIALLFVPIILAVLSLISEATIVAVVSIASFVLAFIAFALFIMADKPKTKKEAFTLEGLWQRLTLLFMFVPLLFVAILYMS